MNKTTIKILYLLTALCLIGLWWKGVGMIQDHQPLSSGLPYYGPDTNTSHQYLVRDFHFTNQDSTDTYRELFENKVWVTDFFFSTCEGICPIMSSNIALIQDSFASDTHVMFLSHTVDPETDDVPTLKRYAETHKAIKRKWYFVTGKKEELYDYARTSYFIASPKDSSLGEDFVHSQLLCLIDPHLHIRGYYDGTNKKDVQKLIQDIRHLEIEYELKSRNKR